MNWQRLLIGNPVTSRLFVPANGSQTAVRLTQPGAAVAFAAACLSAVALVTVLMPDMNNAANQSLASQSAAQASTNARILAASDVAGFVETAYAGYRSGIDAEAETTRQLKPPFSLPIALRRVEYIRPKLTPALYQSLRSSYQQAAKADGIQRDEIVCGLPDYGALRVASGSANSRTATVRLVKTTDSKPAGTFAVTVDLKQRMISAIDCSAM